ncbi:MAG: M48 family metallopeptidase [Phycisphaerales bacterium]|nr:M48 family metallopeptidase [Phycisphaerales bacterium]
MHRIIITCLLGLVLWGCSKNAATGDRQLLLYSVDSEIAMGVEAAPQLTEEYGGAVKNAALQAYVADIGSRMAATTEAYNPDLPWEFTLLDSDVINAFALPGGKVFVSRGLAVRMTNEAQLAAVLGHEIGHVTARHVGDRLSRAAIANGVAVAATVGAGMSDQNWAAAIPLVVGVGGQGYLLKFGRDQELQSDALGVRYMANVGYDPKGAYEVQKILEEASAGGDRPPELLSTHPYPERRQEQIIALLEGEFAYTQNNSEYKLYPERYQSQFLKRLAAMPAAPDRALALEHPVTWCAVCQHHETPRSPESSSP